MKVSTPAATANKQPASAGTWGKGTLPVQRTGFNTLDTWGHKAPTQSKRIKDRKEKIKRSCTRTCIQCTRLHKRRGLSWKILLCSLYIPFRDFYCAFCPATVVSVTVCLVVLGAPFSSEMSCILFFLMSLLASSLSLWFCLFACSGILWVKN